MIYLADLCYTNRAEVEQISDPTDFCYANRAEVEQMICLARFRVIKHLAG